MREIDNPSVRKGERESWSMICCHHHTVCIAVVPTMLSVFILFVFLFLFLYVHFGNIYQCISCQYFEVEFV